MFRNFSGILVLALVLSLGNCVQVLAQTPVTIAFEGFDVDPELDIDGLAGATSFGFDGGFTGVGDNILVQSVAGNIIPAGSPIANVGGHLGIADGPGGGSGDRFARTFDTDAFGTFGFLDGDGNVSGADGTSLYIGFAIQTLAGVNANSAIEFNLDGTVNQFSFGNDGGDVGVGGDNAFGFDVNAASPDFGAAPGDAIAADVDLSVANTFVIRIDYDATGDTATLFANPTGLVEANETPVGSTSTPGVSLAFDAFGFLNFSNSPGALIDEFRIGTTFESALSNIEIPLLDGDTNLDGIVDIEDFNNIVNNFFNTGEAGSLAGEAIGAVDGVVDINDFIAFRTAFEAAGGDVSLLASFTAVPEPSALLLFGSAVLGTCAVRRRNK